MIVHFTIGANSGRQGIRTLIPASGNRFSKAVRQTISAYLPFDRVDPPGIEPGSSVCRTDVLPLDDEPMNQSHHTSSGLPENRTPISGLRSRRRPVGPAAQWPRRESNPQNHEALDLAALPSLRTRPCSNCRPESCTRRAKLMRLRWALARLR